VRYRVRTDFFDAIKLVLAVGITFFAFWAYLKVRRGRMRNSFLLFILLGLITITSTTADLLGFDVAHDLSGIIYLVLLFIALILLYKAWVNFGI